MPHHDHELFAVREDIPDLVPPALILPSDLSHLFVPKADRHTASTTTPIEIGFCFYTFNPFGLSAEVELMRLFEHDSELAKEYWSEKRGNHVGNVVLKSMLDPDRYAPIDFVQVYRSESKFRGHSEHEEAFFLGFPKNWGVLRR